MGPLGDLLGIGQSSSPDVGASSNSAYGLMQALINLQQQAFKTEATYQPQYVGVTTADTGAAVSSLTDLIAKYLPGIVSDTNAANTAAGASAVGAAGALGPAAASAIGRTNPAEAAMLGQLNDTAGSALRAGTVLAPDDTNRITNAVRSGWASRGLGDSGPASLDEALQLYTAGQNVLQQRESEAGGVLNLDNSLVTSPALSLTQQTSTAPVLTNSILTQGEGIAGPAGNTLTDPTSILSAAFNAQAASQITNANNSAALNSY